MLKPYRRTTLLPKRKQQQYCIGTIQTLLRKHSDLGPCCSDRQFARQEHIPIGTLRGWLKRKDEYLEAVKRGSNTTLDAHGQLETFSFGADLVQFMDSTHQKPWLDAFLEGKPDQDRAYKGLLGGWCQAFAHRHGFSQRVPCASKKTQAELQATRAEYAKVFWPKHAAYDPANIINIDETGVHYDMPPRRTWARIGKSSKVDKQQKHSNRRKLPPMVIVHGQTDGGPVEQKELPTYPRGAVYAVQENAWMGERVWEIYLRELLQFEIEAPSVVVVENLAAHVTPGAVQIVQEELFSVVEELPANSTCTCQPLDVGVMGPFKGKCCTEWIHETKVTSAAEKRLAMVQRILKVWEAIPSAMITRSFDKAFPREEL
ncbi:hypothetical protein B5M09_011087 [Aphanomyces astaci]|uniref:DDE-1 domain-containing protein n=1 Tax=Aphanomyces astaci TaxID=112090 RepID=A0A3R7WXF9_APHAT|nr:hypothetical protein B5M09_011087 [Aphanomyces astaci]